MLSEPIKRDKSDKICKLRRQMSLASDAGGDDELKLKCNAD